MNIKRKMRVIIGILFLLIALSTTSYGEKTAWPLKEQIDLASSFGDYRQARFHAGIDLRTGGVPGKPVFSPVDGYILRIRMSYSGYGKGLYVTGDDGCQYVFGHLQKFSDFLDKHVKSVQMQKQRYFVEIEFPKDSLRVRKGDLIAYSGQTGAGAPHLHFEKRTSNNFPLNPLTHGYSVSDNVPPIFQRIGFRMTDERSLFPDGSRLFMRPVTGKNGIEYSFDSVLYFNRQFGVLADCFDRLHNGGMRLGVYKLSLLIDDRLWQEITFDTTDYATTNSANLVYDFEAAQEGDDFVRKLYRQRGNSFAGSVSPNGRDGIIGHNGEISVGFHKGRIVAQDPAGNRAQVTFSFIWGLSGDIYRFDSTRVVRDSLSQFYFTLDSNAKTLEPDSIRIMSNQGGTWNVLPSAKVQKLDNWKVKVEIKKRDLPDRVLRLRLFSKNKCRIDSEPFTGIENRGNQKLSLSHSLTNEGLVVTVTTNDRKASKIRLELYSSGRRVGIEYPSRYFNMSVYRFLVPPKVEYKSVDRIAVAMSEDTTIAITASDAVRLYVVGYEDNREITFDSTCSVIFPKSGLYEPRFVELETNKETWENKLKSSKNPYLLKPDIMLLKEPFEIKYRIPAGEDIQRTGLCRFDSKGKVWSWINRTQKGNTLTGQARLGGKYSVVVDYEKPVISGVNIVAGKTYTDKKPKIRFRLSDDLSGFEDDRNIEIRIDDKWQIPEFDPETRICETVPFEPLAPGIHLLTIKAVDRAGNKAEQTIRFTIQEPTRKQNKK
jgi:hypothetical protein